jgi:serine/arginine repetitive matrix protein 2
MRSVRSLARIGSWAQLRNEEGPGGSVRGGKPLKEKAIKEKAPEEKEGKKKKEKKSKKGENSVEGEEGKKKKKTKKKEKEQKDTLKAQTVRLSTSSFEVGAASPMPNKTLGRKKHSILGLGLPSTMGVMTMRLPTVRNGSTASSAMPPVANRLSVESAVMGMGRDRAGSVMSTSTASSLRPMSTTSSMSGSRVSSGSSVRWDEDCLESVKELRRKERREKEEIRRQEGAEVDVKSNKKEKESRRTSEGRRRTPLSEVFPDVRAESPMPMRRPRLPIVTVEAATADGHSAPDDCVSLMEEDEERYQEEQEVPLETPVKRARARPMSEQLLGRSRPRGMYENEDGMFTVPSN